MPESEIKRMFKDHLTDLGVTSNPAVEIFLFKDNFHDRGGEKGV